jgi:hypothetical protein
MLIALVFEASFRETKQALALALRANTELHRNDRPPDPERLKSEPESRFVPNPN